MNKLKSRLAPAHGQHLMMHQAAAFVLAVFWAVQGGIAPDAHSEEPLPLDMEDFTPLLEEDEQEPVPAAADAPAGTVTDVIDFSEGDVDPRAQMETEVINGTEQITISLDDVSLEDTVRMFAQTTQANIIASGALLEGKRVTVSLRDVDWRPALRSILDIHDLTLAERTPGSGIYSIQARLPDAPDPTEVRTYFLNYTTVTEVKEAINSMLSTNAVLTPFASRNALVVRSNESNLSEVEALLAELDRPGRQVLIEARILELTDDARRAVGIDWSALGAYEVGLTEMEWSFRDQRTRDRRQDDRFVEYDLMGTRRGSLLFEDPAGNELSADPFQSWMGQPDFDGVFREAEWEGTPRRYRTTEQAFGAGAESRRSREAQQLYEDVKSAILSPADFRLVLSALQTTDGVSMVSNPKMIVTSGSTNAFFSVGDREPIIETERERARIEGQPDLLTSRLATGINTEFITEGYLETGIDLRVLATVKTDDYIEADIRPSLRRLIDFKRVGDNSWPIISVKEIGTSFTLRSGQTVAIGGLTESQDAKKTSRVPILGNIPLLGRLFRHEQDVTEQVETIIFVTLTIADPDILEHEAGIPVDSRLVHSRLLRERAARQEWERDFNAQRDAFEAGLDLQDTETEPAADTPAWLPEEDGVPRAAPTEPQSQRNMNDVLPR